MVLDRLLEKHGYKVIVIAFAFVMAISFAISDFYILPAQERSWDKFIMDCEQQGGSYVELNRRQTCIIDGVRIGRD